MAYHYKCNYIHADLICIWRRWTTVKGPEVSPKYGAGDEGGDPRENGSAAHELNSTTATLCGLFQVMSLVAGRPEVA